VLRKNAFMAELHSRIVPLVRPSCGLQPCTDD
jgi:hypothetical protein